MVFLNEVCVCDEFKGVLYYCFFVDVFKLRNFGENLKLYVIYQNFVLYVNVCLERLDYEFSIIGGLFSILLMDQEGRENFNYVCNIFLGQWLVYMQYFVGWMYEFERFYNNVFDVLVGEVLILSQYFFVVGFIGVSEGCFIVYL